MADEDTAPLLLRIALLESENALLRDAQEQAGMLESRRSATLMAGVQHRIRNMLATIRAIVSRTEAADGSIEHFVAHLQGRLDTLARVQSALIRTNNGGLDLEEMVREEFIAQGGSGIDQVEVNGPSVRLRDQAAELIGLALHELAVNAVKFGSLSTASGHVAVWWRVERAEGQPWLVVHWRESGATGVSDEYGRGFGRELIEDGLPYQLSAKTSVEFEPDGIHCSIRLPVSVNDEDGGVCVVVDTPS